MVVLAFRAEPNVLSFDGDLCIFAFTFSAIEALNALTDATDLNILAAVGLAARMLLSGLMVLFPVWIICLSYSGFNSTTFFGTFTGGSFFFVIGVFILFS